MRDDRVYLRHILDCCERVSRFTSGGRESFFGDDMVRDATLRSLQTLAESCTRLSDELKTGHPEVDWRGIAGFRNVIVHDYLGVDLEIVWEIVQGDLPVLESAARSMLGKLEAD